MVVAAQPHSRLSTTTTMFEHINSVYRRRNELGKKLIRNPFFPLLFISETIKTATIAAATAGSLITATVVWLAVVSVVVTVLWVFAEHFLDEAEETYNELTDE